MSTLSSENGPEDANQRSFWMVSLCVCVCSLTECQSAPNSPDFVAAFSCHLELLQTYHVSVNTGDETVYRLLYIKLFKYCFLCKRCH